MSRPQLPPPAVGIEALARHNFLPEQQPYIDMTTGSPTRLLAQLALTHFDKRFTIAELGAQIQTFQGNDTTPPLPPSLKRDLYSYTSDFAAQRLATASFSHQGLFNQDILSVRSTDKGRRCAPFIGVFAVTALEGTPVGTLLSRPRRRQSGQPALYPYAPTFRLRVAQELATSHSAYIEDVAPKVGRTIQQMRLQIALMKKDRLIYSSGDIHAKGIAVPYRLTTRARQPLTNLLLRLHSLHDPRFRQAASDAAASLVHPETGPPLVRTIVENWHKPVGAIS
jgi:hypothetical protein